jgi:hypothetical protein
MLHVLDGLPDGVIGFQPEGELHAEDFRDVLLPALEAATAAGAVRFVIVFAEWDGMTPGAVWEDLKIGFEHLRAWKRIALVTDVEWMTHLASLFGWMTPGELKVFPLAQRGQAISWVAEG